MWRIANRNLPNTVEPSGSVVTGNNEGNIGTGSISAVNEGAQSTALLPEDVKAALDNLVHQYTAQEPVTTRWINPEQSLYAARAPGRLDVMGGVADYSGSTVLQLPLKESAVVFCQRFAKPVVTVISIDAQRSQKTRCVSLPLEDFHVQNSGKAKSIEAMKNYFSNLADDDRWVAYIAGVIPVLLAESNRVLEHGLVIYLHSSVPEGKGVSSSAAIEVATMRCVSRLLHLSIDAHRQALLCQQVENRIVGAPCGLMDQMTTSVGLEGSLLQLLCQPDKVLEPVYLPQEIAIYGIDSGVRHAVSGSDYSSVRVAAFMGYRMILAQSGVAPADVPASSIRDTRWGGYLANISPSEFMQHFAQYLPLQMSGHEFLNQFDATTDSVTTVDPAGQYAVRACTAHPVHEHFRVKLFAQLISAETLLASVHTDALMQLSGEAMYQSHASYSACGLGSEGTDELLSRLRQAGIKSGIYGARITGGGSGGTVAILALKSAEGRIEDIARSYARDSGIGGQVFRGSSNGARDFLLEPD